MDSRETKMPAGRPSLYDPSYCNTVIDLGRLGKSQVQIACALDVDPASLRRWADEHEEFRLALTRAKAEEQNWWEQKGQDGLTADKFNSAVWAKSMSARFRDDYTERRQNEHSGPNGGPVPFAMIEMVPVQPKHDGSEG